MDDDTVASIDGLQARLERTGDRIAGLESELDRVKRGLEYDVEMLRRDVERIQRELERAQRGW